MVGPEMNVKIVDSSPDGGVISHMRKYNYKYKHKYKREKVPKIIQR